MRHSIKKMLFAVGIACFSYVATYAQSMQLTYDGTIHNYELDSIHLYINNQKMETKVMPPIQLGDRVVVPAREVFEPMGATVEWKTYEKKVYIYNNVSLMTLTVDSTVAWVDGETKELDMPAKLINDKIMIPIRFISEQLGYQVDWNGTKREINITQQPEVEPPIVLPPEPEVEPPVEPSEPEIVLPVEPSEPEVEPPIVLPPEPEITPPIEPEIPSIPPDTIQNTMQNIEYEESTGTLIVKNLPNVNINSMQTQDLYRERKWIIDLGEDYEEYIGYGYFSAMTGKIKQITPEHGSTTKLIVETFSVEALNITNEEEELHIQFVKPKEKYEKVIVIDPGHGGSDPGTSVAGVQEKDVNLAFAMEVKNRFEQDDTYKLYMVREEDQTVVLQDRPPFANDIDPDIYISIHNNYVDNKDIKGTETFFFQNPNDARGQELAKLIQQGIINELGMNDRKAKANNGYYVLRKTHMPAILVEVGFLSNDEDRVKLQDLYFTMQFADVMYNAVNEYFMMYPPIR